MTWCVNDKEPREQKIEINFTFHSFHVVQDVRFWEISGTNLLSDSTSFACLYLSSSELIQNQSFTCVDVTHDTNDGASQFSFSFKFLSLLASLNCFSSLIEFLGSTCSRFKNILNIIIVDFLDRFLSDIRFLFVLFFFFFFIIAVRQLLRLRLITSNLLDYFFNCIFPVIYCIFFNFFLLLLLFLLSLFTFDFLLFFLFNISFCFFLYFLLIF